MNFKPQLQASFFHFCTCCLPVGLCCSERFLEQFLKYMTMRQQRHCWFMFGEPIFKITFKTCYHWPSFTLLVSLEWPEASERLWPQLHPQQHSFLLEWGCVSFLSQGSCCQVTAVFGELRFLGCAYSSYVWIMVRMFRDFLPAFISLFSLSL